MAPPLLGDAEARGEALFWNYDNHMRSEGYRRVGRAVYEWWTIAAEGGDGGEEMGQVFGTAPRGIVGRLIGAG